MAAGSVIIVPRGIGVRGPRVRPVACRAPAGPLPPGTAERGGAAKSPAARRGGPAGVPRRRRKPGIPPGQRFIDSPEFPPQYLETAQDQADALEILRAAQTPVAWSYVSRPPCTSYQERRPATTALRSATPPSPMRTARAASRSVTTPPQSSTPWRTAHSSARASRLRTEKEAEPWSQRQDAVGRLARSRGARRAPPRPCSA